MRSMLNFVDSVYSNWKLFFFRLFPASTTNKRKYHVLVRALALYIYGLRCGAKLRIGVWCTNIQKAWRPLMVTRARAGFLPFSSVGKAIWATANKYLNGNDIARLNVYGHKSSSPRTHFLHSDLKWIKKHSSNEKTRGWVSGGASVTWDILMKS